MRFTFTVIIAALILTACATSSTPAPTIDVILHATATIIPPIETAIPTATVTFTPTSAEIFDPLTMDKIEKIMFSDPVENVTYNDVIINGAFDVAESAYQVGVHEVTMPDALGAEILSEAVFTLWYYHGPNPHKTTDVPTDAERAEFFKIWAEVQKGERPCSDIQVNPFAFDADVPGLEQKQMPLEIMCGAGQVSEGARGISEIEVQYIEAISRYNDDLKRFEMDSSLPRVIPTDIKDTGAGFETEVDGDRLRIKIALPHQVSSNYERNTASTTYKLFTWLKRNDGRSEQYLAPSSTNLKNGDDLISSGFDVKSIDDK